MDDIDQSRFFASILYRCAFGEFLVPESIAQSLGFLDKGLGDDKFCTFLPHQSLLQSELSLWIGNAGFCIENYFIDMSRVSIALKDVKMCCAPSVCKNAFVIL